MITKELPDNGSVQREARDWAKLLTHYRQPSNMRGSAEILITIVPLIALWAFMWATLGWGYWLTLLLAIPAAGLLVRLFMIQHDCGHGSFMRSRKANDLIGRVTGVLTLTPYDHWQRMHALHHAGSGNLDRRGFGDVHTLTVEEYRAQSMWGRMQYRLYRHPLVMFGVGPAYLFLLQHRLPIGMMRGGVKPWISTLGTNLAIALFVVAMMWFLGIKPFLMVHIPIVLLAASIGVWLFFVQHQFEQTSWEYDREWNWHEAALHGSSHYDLPLPMRWFTANIGLHHIHHLCSRIPYYRLPSVLRDHPILRDVSRLTFWQSLGCVRLVLWDDARNRLVTFRDARQAIRATATH